MDHFVRGLVDNALSNPEVMQRLHQAIVANQEDGFAAVDAGMRIGEAQYLSEWETMRTEAINGATAKNLRTIRQSWDQAIRGIPVTEWKWSVLRFDEPTLLLPDCEVWGRDASGAFQWPKKDGSVSLYIPLTPTACVVGGVDFENPLDARRINEISASLSAVECFASVLPRDLEKIRSVLGADATLVGIKQLAGQLEMVAQGLRDAGFDCDPEDLLLPGETLGS